MNSEFSKTYFVSANEANPEGELGVNVLVSDLIMVATQAANELGIGNPSMAHLNAGWVLSRLTIEMERYPKVNTDYRIITWVESWNRHFSVRDFEIQNCEGKTLGFGRSIWMVLNTITHDNFGLSHLSLSEGAVSKRICPIVRQDKHVEILSEMAGDTPTSALIANMPVRRYTFQYNDIDFYRHVNTVRYVTLLLNSYSLEDFDRCFLHRLELSFLHEGTYGETVEIRRFNHDADISSFSLVPEKEEKPILFARIRLKERQ